MAGKRPAQGVKARGKNKPDVDHSGRASSGKAARRSARGGSAARLGRVSGGTSGLEAGGTRPGAAVIGDSQVVAAGAVAPTAVSTVREKAHEAPDRGPPPTLPTPIATFTI